MRSARDGEPYFCDSCGAAINSNCGYDSGYCRVESREKAQKRRAEWLLLEERRQQISAAKTSPTQKD